MNEYPDAAELKDKVRVNGAATAVPSNQKGKTGGIGNCSALELWLWDLDDANIALASKSLPATSRLPNSIGTLNRWVAQRGIELKIQP